MTPNRRWAAGALVVLTIVAMLASTLAIWTQQTVTDTDRFMAIVEPALNDPAFYDALSSAVTEASLEALDLEPRVATLLDGIDATLADALVTAIDPDPDRLDRLDRLDRPTLGALAPTISQPLEARVAEIIDRFVTSEEFQARLPDLVRQGHTAGVAILTDDLDALPYVYVEEGDLRIDLVPVIVEALQGVAAELRGLLPDITLPAVLDGPAQQGREQLRDQLAASLQVQLPDDFGQVTVMQRATLSELQTAARYVDRAVWAITLTALALLAAAIAVSPHRRRTIIQLAFGMAAGFAASTLLIDRIEATVVARITDPDGSQAVGSLLRELASDLRTITVVLIVAAVVAGILAFLIGTPRLTAVRERRQTRPTAPKVDDRPRFTTPTVNGREIDRWVANHADALRITGLTAAGAGVLVLIGIDPVTLLVIGAALGIYLQAIAAARRRNAAPEPVVSAAAVASDEQPAPDDPPSSG